MDRVRRQAKILKSKGYRVVITTNDGFDRSIPRIPGQSYLSGRFDSLLKFGPVGRKDTRCIRIGLEGISERMRVLIGKPATNKQIANVSWQLAKNGIDVRWFFIPGLPGETEDDYRELKDLILWLRKSNYPRIVLTNMHAFLPMPATPFGILPLEDSYYDRFHDFYWWHTGGPGYTDRFHLVSPCMPKERLRRSRMNMAASEDELREGWFKKDNPNWRIKYPASPQKLRRLAQEYLNKLNRAAA